jgi:hypothetical protein
LPAADWSRPLPRPITIPTVMKLSTLDDLRVLVNKHLPTEYRSKFAWRKLAALLRRAAAGKDDRAEVSAAAPNHPPDRAGAVPGAKRTGYLKMCRP